MPARQPPRAPQSAVHAAKPFDLYAPIPGLNPLLGAVFGPDGRPVCRQAETAYLLAIGFDLDAPEPS